MSTVKHAMFALPSEREIVCRREFDAPRVTVTTLFETAEDREAMLASGMEAGAAETWVRFAALVQTARKEQAHG